MHGQPIHGDLSINPELVTEILVRFIRNEITRTGFRRAVFGLSGGIDSSVVAYLAARAMGPENVLAVIVALPTLKRPPPMPEAVLPDTVQLFTTSVPVLWLLSAAP